MPLLEERYRGNGHRVQEAPEARSLDAELGNSRLVIQLSLLVALLGAIVAGAGLLWQGSGQASSVTTFRGQTVEIYGRGLYQNDTLFMVGNNRASDIVVLAVGIPLLVASIRLYSRGSVRARLLLLGTLGFFVYVSATYALGGVAFNQLFFVYVAFLSASIFAFITVFLTFDPETVTRAFQGDMPRRLAGTFLIASGVITLAIWVMEPLASLLSGDPPQSLNTHTTLFTHAFDIAIIVPAAMAAGIMILRGRAFGYVVAFSLLVLEALLLPLIAIATAVQIDLGIEFTPAEIVGPIAGFGVFAAGALAVIIVTLSRMPPVRTDPVFRRWAG